MLTPDPDPVPKRFQHFIFFYFYFYSVFGRKIILYENIYIFLKVSVVFNQRETCTSNDM